MNSWDILLNILGWGLSIIAGILLTATIFITIVSIVKVVQDKFDRTTPSLQALRDAGKDVARERYKNDPLYATERAEAFIDGVAWCYDIMRRK